MDKKMITSIDLKKIREIKKKAIIKKQMEREGMFLIREGELKTLLSQVIINLQTILEETVQKGQDKCVIVDDLDICHYEKSLVLKDFIKTLRDNGIEAYKEKHGLGDIRFRIFCYIN